MADAPAGDLRSVAGGDDGGRIRSGCAGDQYSCPRCVDQTGGAGGRATADAETSAEGLASVTHIEWRTAPVPGEDPSLACRFSRPAVQNSAPEEQPTLFNDSSQLMG